MPFTPSTVLAKTPAPAPPPSVVVGNLRDLHIYYFAAAVISIVLCLFVIFSYARFKILRHHPSSLVFWRTIFDTFFAMTFIILYFLPAPKDRDGLDSPCDWLGPWFHFTLLGSQSWYFMITIDLLYALLRPFSNLRSMVKWYHLYVWGTSAAAVIIIRGANRFKYRPLFQVCWISSSDDLLNVFSWGLLFVPTIIYLVVSFFVTGYAYLSLKRGLDKTAEIRERVILDGAKYNAVFLVYWVIALVLYQALYSIDSQGAENTQSDSTFSLFAVVIGGLGVADAVAWFITNKKIFEAWRLMKKQGRGEEFQKKEAINMALRQEILYYTTSGIIAAQDLAGEEQRLGTTPIANSDYFAKSRKLRKEQGANVEPGLFEIPLEGRNDKSNAHFIDYSPQIFRFLRKRFGISTRVYQDSINGDSGTMLAKYSEGRSAAFFFFTADSHFIVKTLEKGEMNLLLQILPEYCKYMEKNPDSLINRFVGLHSIQMYHTTLYLIVMESVFLTDKPIHERYDLKGSWIDRHTKDTRSGILGFSKGVMKDSDLHTAILLSEHKRKLLIEQSEKDSRFLCDLGIMDYSILVGVRYVRQIRIAPGRTSEIMRKKLSQAQEHPPPEAKEGSPPESVSGLPAPGESFDGRLTGKRVSDPVRLCCFQFSAEGSQDPDAIKMTSPVADNTSSNDLKVPLMSSKKISNDFDIEDNPIIVGLGHEIQSTVSADGISSFQIEDGGLPAEVVEGPGIYYFGIIDILQEWNFSKKMERFFKTWILRKHPDGVSCVTPGPYQMRFMSKIHEITEATSGHEVTIAEYQD